MYIKGIDQLREHVLDLRSPQGLVRAGLYFLGWILLVTYYFLTTDQIPTRSIDSQVIVMALGMLILGLFFSRKESYKAEYGELAYRNAIAHFGIPGLASLGAAIAHAGYMNGPFVPRGWWTTVFIMLGWYLLITGLLLLIRSLLTFGLDYASFLYVYFHEEGKIVSSSIYGILRHPILSSALRIGIGLALLNGNANALVFALLMPLLVFGWIRLVEEKELLERFGPAYVEYR